MIPRIPKSAVDGRFADSSKVEVADTLILAETHGMLVPVDNLVEYLSFRCIYAYVGAVSLPNGAVWSEFLHSDCEIIGWSLHTKNGIVDSSNYFAFGLESSDDGTITRLDSEYPSSTTAVYSYTLTTPYYCKAGNRIIIRKDPYVGSPTGDVFFFVLIRERHVK